MLATIAVLKIVCLLQCLRSSTASTVVSRAQRLRLFADIEIFKGGAYRIQLSWAA